jgi:hypothetical protein
VLSYDGITDLSWVWTDPDPANWAIDESADGITWTSDVVDYPGATRSAGITGTGVYQRIWGADAFFNQVTDFSNVVFVP